MRNILILGSAVWYSVGFLPMSGCSYILAIIGIRMVGDYAIFTKTQKSRLDLTGFDGKICHKRDNYVNAIIIWSKFQSINDFILRN